MSLSVQGLSLAFGSKTVLDGFDLVLQQGETACLLGHSGCGKTTALRAIAGFEVPKSGTIVLNGTDLLPLPPHRRRIGMVFQDYALFPHLNVADNITFGLFAYSRSYRRKRVGELLEMAGLCGLDKYYPHQLSGGQQQRVALARALAPAPGLILLDEPFSNLDADLRTRLSKDVRRLLKEAGTSALMVTHDQHEAFAMADKIGVLHEGRMLQWDTPANLYRRPADLYTASFIGGGSAIGGIVERGGVHTALGYLKADVSAFSVGDKVLGFIRPEQLVLADASSGYEVQVADCDFKGGYCVCTVLLPGGETVLLHTVQMYLPGSRLFVACVGDAVFFLD